MFLNNNSIEIDKAQKQYENFVKEVNDSDLADTMQRYIAELHYVRKLKEFYIESNAKSQLDNIAIREREILEELKNNYGITEK